MWPWAADGGDADHWRRLSLAERDRSEMAARQSQAETKARIVARWAEIERDRAIRRRVAALTFSAHLVSAPTPERQIRPLRWAVR